MFDDWKEHLAPFIGLKADPDTFAALKKLRCPRWVRTEEGLQGNGQYALNAAGTAKLERTPPILAWVGISTGPHAHRPLEPRLRRRSKRPQK